MRGTAAYRDHRPVTLNPASLPCGIAVASCLNNKGKHQIPVWIGMLATLRTKSCPAFRRESSSRRSSLL